MESNNSKVDKIWSGNSSNLHPQDWRAPDRPSNCTWTHNSSTEEKKKCPHVFYKPDFTYCRKPVDSALDLIGLTPMIRLHRMEKYFGLQCELYGKCEYYNPGGSVKDRIAHRMIQDAEEKGILKPGSTIIEPTSGNTGIGLAMAAAIKGYKCIIVLPEKMSGEKVNVLKALGAEIVRTPTSARYDSPESHISVAQRLNAEIPNSIILDQYTNPYNPIVHYEATAEEILHQLDGKVDMVVASPGTGGTITGLSRRLKEHDPNIKLVGPDPVGSVLSPVHEFKPEDNVMYEVEGIGYDFIPTVLDVSGVDIWYKSRDKESFEYALLAMKIEGLLCGGSSGTNLYYGIDAARSLGPGQRCVVILPDSVRNYMSKFLSNDWRVARDLNTDLPENSQAWWFSKKVSDMDISTPLTITEDVTCKAVMDIMQKTSYDQIPVVNKNDATVKGVVTLGNLTSRLLSGTVTEDSLVEKVTYAQFSKATADMTLGRVSKMLDSGHFVLVVRDQKLRSGNDGNEIITKTYIHGIITQMDILKYITAREAKA